MNSAFLAAVVAGLASVGGFRHAPEDACPACAPFWQHVAAVLGALETEADNLAFARTTRMHRGSMAALAVAAAFAAVGLYCLVLGRRAQAEAIKSMERMRRIPVLGPIYCNPLMEWWVSSRLCLWTAWLIGIFALCGALWLAYLALTMAR